MVKDLIDPETLSWKTDIIQETFLNFEAAQIIQLPLSPYQQEDTLVWLGTKNGNYSVRSGYYTGLQWNQNQGHMASSSSQNEDKSWDSL
jgi:hypothetical protein